MPEIRVETDIAGSAEDIFDVIVDLRGYDRWLPASTHVVRVVDLTLPLALKPAWPIVLRAFRQEIERTVAALKAYVESSTPRD